MTEDLRNSFKSTHIVLRNDDLLAMIFDELDLWNKTDVSTCGGAARVCRAWEAPASNRLWRRLVSMGPLPFYEILHPSSQEPRKQIRKRSAREGETYYTMVKLTVASFWLCMTLIDLLFR